MLIRMKPFFYGWQVFPDWLSQIHSLFPHNAVFWWVLFADVNVTCWQGAPPKSPEPMPVDKGEPKEDEVKKLSDAWAATCTRMVFLNLSVMLVGWHWKKKYVPWKKNTIPGKKYGENFWTPWRAALYGGEHSGFKVGVTSVCALV